MALAFPKFRIAVPLRYEAVSVFPLFSDVDERIAYRLSVEALADKSVSVNEVNDAGNVNQLRVENKNDVSVLFIEGEELIGAKQNRILNTSVLVAAHSTLVVPVSCVEQGRWRYTRSDLDASDGYAPSKLRRALKPSVTRSLKQKLGYLADQVAVWKQVDDLQAEHGVKSGTSAMSDTFAKCRGRIAEYRRQLPYVAGATGLAVGVGEQIVAIDVFDKPTTCQRIWDRLLCGVIVDSLLAGPAESQVEAADVQQLLDAIVSAPWEQAPAVGEGDEFRADVATAHGSALTVRETLVHGSVAVAV